MAMRMLTFNITITGQASATYVINTIVKPLAFGFGALIGLAGGFGIADNIHAGLTLAFGGGLSAYAGELGVAILAVAIASLWAVIIGLAVHLSLANIVAYYLSELSDGIF